MTANFALTVLEDQLSKPNEGAEPAPWTHGRSADRQGLVLRSLALVTDLPKVYCALALARVPYPVGLGILIAAIASLSVGIRMLDPSVIPNLATNSKVTSGSAQSQTTSADGLIDGDIWTIGFDTHDVERPWILIDLIESAVISRIIIHNRVDCCQADAVPLDVELGNEEQKFNTVARNAEPFESWSIDTQSRRARYVRLRLNRYGALRLTEIEVL